MRSHVRTGCVSWLSLVPDSITWLSIAAHPPTLGSLRPVPVGRPTSYHHRLSHDSLTSLIRNNTHRKYELKQSEKSFQEGRSTVYLDWRQYYVIWRPVASLASWPRVSCGHQHIMAPVVSGQGTRSQGGKEADQGPPVTWVTRHEEGFEAGERLRGLCLWTGAWLRTEAGTSDRELRLRAPASAAHPQLWPHRQARTRTLPTKYSRFFSPLKCVLNLLSFSLKSSRTQRIPVPNSAQRGQRRFGGSYSDRQGWYGYKFQETLIVSHVILNARNMVEECEVPGHLTSDHEGAMWGVCECLASGHQGDPEEIEAGCWQTQH